MQRSYERRRWLRDGGRGGAGLSRRGASCCGVSIVIFFVLFFWAPRAGKESSRRAAAFFSFAAPRPSRGRKHASSPPSHCAASPRRKQRRDARTRFFVTAWQRGGPCQVASFFLSSLFIKPRRPADERSRARQTRTSGVPVPTWPIICAALRAISSRSQNRGKTLRFRARVAWNGKSSGAMGRCRQAPS